VTFSWPKKRKRMSMNDAPGETTSPKRPLTRARKTRCCARTNIGSLPVELQAKVFDTFVWLGTECRNSMPVGEAKVRLERLLTMRLVTTGLATCYLGDMARIKFQLHMQKRCNERAADPNRNQMLRSIFYRCAEAADMTAVSLYSIMAPQSDKAAFEGLKQILGMHKDQVVAWEAVEKEHPGLMQNFPGM